MNESTHELRARMLAAADRLQKLECWQGPPTNITEVIDRMQDGGEPGNQAWVWLLQRMVALPPDHRLRAEKCLSEYQQTIGRWFIAANHERLAKVPFPQHGTETYVGHGG